MKRGILIIFLMLLFTISVTNSTSFWSGFGKETRTLDSQEVVTYVGNEPVTLREVHLIQLTSEYNNRLDPSLKKLSYEEALDIAIENTLIRAEAKNNGLWPTEKETLQYIDNIRNALNQLPEEEKELWQEFLHGYGMSEEEFFADKNTKNTYASFLATDKLKIGVKTDWNEFLLQLKEKYIISWPEEKKP